MRHKKRTKTTRPSKNRRSPIPILVGLSGLALLVLAGLALWGRGSQEPKAAVEVNGAPSLKVDQEKLDLGNVKLGQPVEVSFKLTNVGDQPLRFSQEPFVEVKEGC